MNVYIIRKSTLKTKKYDVFNNKKKISFGASGYTDFTTNHDIIKKINYIKRHIVNEDWTNLNKAGTWSRFILWNKKTIDESIKDMEHHFKIKIYVDK